MVRTLKIICKSTTVDEVDEIRQFAVIDDVLYKYDLLVRKILEHLPILQSANIRISWKDSEDDFITISNNEELAEAVSNFEGGIVKLYIGIINDPILVEARPCPSAQPSMLHPNVICDACHGAVHGHRYKCLECADYDLCSSCHWKDKHPFHNMLKIISAAMNPFSESYVEAARIMQKNCLETNISIILRNLWYHTKRNEKTKSSQNKNSQKTDSVPKKECSSFEKALDFAHLLDLIGINLEIKVSENKLSTDAGNAGEMEKNDQSRSEGQERDETKEFECTQNYACVGEAYSPLVNASVCNAGALNNNTNSEVPIAPPVVSVTNIPHPSLGPRISSSAPVMPQYEEVSTPRDNDSVMKSLEVMCAMGFSNEGDRLLKLLQACDGNINSVLDLYCN